MAADGFSYAPGTYNVGGPYALGGQGWGGGHGYGDGFGGGGFLGLLALLLLGRRGFGGDGCDDNCAREAALLQAISNAKDTTVAEGRNLLDAVCDAEKTNLQQFYAAAIQNAANTQSIKDQASSFAVVNDARFDAIERAGVNQTAAILARINDVENQGLRDQLAEARRRSDTREHEININNINTNSQLQAQAQAQVQLQRDFDLHRRFDVLFNQINRTGQDIINLGTMTASGTQATQATNIKS